MPLSDPIKRATLLAEQAASAPGDGELKLQALAAVGTALDQLIERTELQAISIFSTVRLQPLPVLAPVPDSLNQVSQAELTSLPEVQADPATDEPPLPAI
ncbi:hypothetical protein SAMN05660463_02608 [Pseudomonas sp. URIL14HWK12:I9]|nr:hypothetical protein F474_03291 [Pseudomonas sp. URIL14HWK12:I12]PVZ23354.1 hypothetical protein F470_02911 [Pseudomonas sp. URIL14HWK12:I10]PVZ32684.1 hypothetical protein F472_03259 [Pseudomonas sp. URIL14HWK12:I11]SNZ13838.1 hypothetical protein SAMN05660463_02608 [Pseudomonas sp. URIL14HWK12:I9]